MKCRYMYGCVGIDICVLCARGGAWVLRGREDTEKLAQIVERGREKEIVLKERDARSSLTS
jgi:hypothetical protein